MVSLRTLLVLFLLLVSVGAAASAAACVGDGRGLIEIWAPSGSQWMVCGPWGCFFGAGVFRPVDPSGQTCIVVDGCWGPPFQATVKFPDGTTVSSPVFGLNTGIDPAHNACYYLFDAGSGTTPPTLQLTAKNVVVNPGYQGWPTFGRTYTVTLEVENPSGSQTTRSITAHETTAGPVLKDDHQWIPELPYQLYFMSQQRNGLANFYYMHTGDPFYPLKSIREESGALRVLDYILKTEKAKFDYTIDKAIESLKKMGVSATNLGPRIMDFLKKGSLLLDIKDILETINTIVALYRCTPTVHYLYQFTAENVYARLPLYTDPTSGAVETYEGPLDDYPGFWVTVQAQAGKLYAFGNAMFDELLSLVFDILSATDPDPLTRLALDIASILTSGLAERSIDQALDPVPDYTAPVEIEPLIVTEIDSLPDGPAKEYLHQLEATYSDTTGLTDATIKYNAAVAARDASWIEKLLKEQYTYQSRVTNDYYTLKIKAVPFIEELQRTGLNPTEDEIQSVKDDISRNGLPESEGALYKKYGYSENDLGIIRDLISTVPDRFVVNYPSMILISHQMSEHLHSESLRDIASELGDRAPPYADFTASTTSGVSPLSIRFTDASLRSPNRWTWSFGDGGTSDQPSLTHTYTSPGTYTVSLTVSNNDGSDTRTRFGYVQVIIPVKVKILPRTLNLASKGVFVAFVRLPDEYETSGVLKDTVTCSGAPAERIIRNKRFPHVFGAIFRRENLQDVLTGDKITLTMDGKISQAGMIYEFSGSDAIRVIEKGKRKSDELEDVSKSSDADLFDQYIEETK